MKKSVQSEGLRFVFSRWRCLWTMRRNWPFTVCSSTTANWRTARRTANSSTCSTSWSSTRWEFGLMLILSLHILSKVTKECTTSKNWRWHDQTWPHLLQFCCISGLGSFFLFCFCPSKCIDFPCLCICLYIMVSVRNAWAHWHFMFLRVILCSSCRWWSSWSLFSVVWLFHSYWWSRTSPPSPSTEEWHRKKGVCASLVIDTWNQRFTNVCQPKTL